MKNLLQLRSLSNEEIINILDDAIELQNGKPFEKLSDKIVANLFFEPSTRTQNSFMVAQHRLGCQVMSFQTATSSVVKGESFYDTVKTFEAIGVDAIVIRSKEDEYYNQLLGHISVPILNAGDGVKDHPTQSLLDLMTIYKEYGHFSGLKIAIVGDIKHSRVAHTNIEVMERLGMDCYIAGPEEYLDDSCKHIDFDEAVDTMDVIMMLRVQHERHDSAMALTKEEYNAKHGMTMERVARMKPTAIIMHPAPVNRGVEIADEAVECEKSRIFPQMNNGVFIRMAVIRRAFED